MSFIILLSLALWIYFPFYLVSLSGRRRKARELHLVTIFSKITDKTLAIYITALVFSLVPVSEPFMGTFDRGIAQEAQYNLKSIHSAQTIYFQKHKTYAGAENPEEIFKLLSWKPKPRDDRYETIWYGYYCGKDHIGKDDDFSYYTYGVPEKPYSTETKITSKTYECMAFGKTNSDHSYPDVWSINEKGELIHLYDDFLGMELQGKTDWDISKKKLKNNKYLVLIFLLTLAILVWRLLKQADLLAELLKDK